MRDLVDPQWFRKFGFTIYGHELKRSEVLNEVLGFLGEFTVDCGLNCNDWG